MNQDELLKNIKKTYDDLHRSIFPVGIKNAEIKLRIKTEKEINANIPDIESHYSQTLCPDVGSITIVVTEGDLSDGFKLLYCPITNRNPIWERDLLHEIIHEYQYKVLSRHSQEGIDFKKTRKSTFIGNGHDCVFYSALVECSRILGITPEQLEQNI